MARLNKRRTEFQPLTPIANGEDGFRSSVLPRGESEASDRTGTDEIANLVHDLRTPFVAIRGYTKMMLGERAGPITGTQREYLTIVAENVNRVVQLLNELLQLTEKKALHVERLDLRALWREALLLVTPRAMAKAVRITERIPADPVVILGDREKLVETFAEIISQAAKLAGRDGSIVLEAANPDQEESTAIRISHVPAEHSAQLLESLNNVAQREASPSGGSGSAAFSAAQTVLRAHGGRMSAVSEAEGGISLLVALPGVRRED
ncbi:MAG: HAMP domain-containing histidine kinase [Acidobacteria bacterium]|nr:HAMP domain-containing histidine kinase [Acidobacteriota bacterium]